MTNVTFDSTDLDNALADSGVAHEATTNTDHSNTSLVKQGYDIASPYKSSSLVGYWPFHEDSGSTAYDFSDGNNDGTINGATVDATGLLGTTSYSFDGSGDYVDIPAYSTFSAYTVSAWCYMPTFSAISDLFVIRENQAFLGRTRSTTSGDQQITDGFEVAQDLGSSSAYVETTMPVGSWTHFVASWDGSTLVLYKNGSQVDSVSAGSMDSSINDVTEIGGRSSADRYWSGRIWDFRVYNTALSSSDVQTLYDVVNTNGQLTTQGKLS